MFPPTILSLPNPLILLIHLHILEYPHANKPEYDHAMFTTSRGLRDRMKTMEDVAYFLVAKLEGGSVRTILTTYPCVSPSDSVAFRTSLSKYLESLRHSSVYPSSGSNPKSTSTAKSKPTRGAAPAESKIPVAWWWKDVIVRKSLLEECCGEKFERVVLSLSTHTLLKTLKKPEVVNSQDDIINLIRTQPQIYTDLVSRTQSARHAWARSVAALLRRGEDLKLLRARLLQTESSKPSKYDTMPTDHLIFLSQAKLNDLLRGSWAGKWGREALEFLIDVAGVKPSTPLSTKPKIITSKPNAHPQSAPQPLPIAAAHYPSHIKKLKKPIFSASSTTNRKSIAPAQTSNKSYAGVKLAFADTLENEKRVYASLCDALAMARKSVVRVRERMRVLEERAKPKGRGTGTVLWVPRERRGFEYQTEPTPTILARLGLKVPDVKGGIGRIDEIRAGLTAWPPLPDISGLSEEEGVREGMGGVKTKIPMRGSVAGLPRPKAFRGKTASDTAAVLPSTTGGLPPAPKDVGAMRNGAGDGKRKASQKAEKNDTRTSPHKSIRFSIAAVRRKSMFAEDYEVDEEISRIISTAEDTSTELDPLVQATPQRRINRIYTAGTPRVPARKVKAKVRGERMSYVMPADDPGPLPRLVSNGSEFWERDEEEVGVGSVDAGVGEEDDEEGEEEGYEEAPSVTIRDILLQSEGGFDLLEYDQDGIGEESFDSQWD